MTLAHVYRKSRFFWQKTNKRGLSPWRDMRICWPLGIFYSILIMRWNTITSSSTPCFAHCLGHQCKICSHLLLFIFQLLEVRELFSGIWRSIGDGFHKTFQKIRTISIQKKDYLCSLLWNYEANCKGTLHFDLKLYCFLKNFVRFMPNTFQNDIQKTSEWINSMWWTWKKCCNPGLANNYPVTL